MASSKLHQLLDEQSTHKHFIEYRVFLSNHLAHGIIALHKLGATDDDLQAFVSRYIPRLEAAKDHQEPDASAVHPDKPAYIAELLGQRKDFYFLLREYQERLQKQYGGKLDAFVRGEFAQLADGLHCAALHPLIHTGYGLSVGSATIVVEGLAYLHFSHMRTRPIPRDGSERCVDIFDALKRLKESTGLMAKVKTYAAVKTFMPGITGEFQRFVGVLCSHPYVRSQVQLLVESLQLPAWFNLADASVSDVRRLMDTVLHWALTVYACAEKRNDFFLLHGVTGAWSLLQVLQTYTDPLPAFDAVQTYIATLFAAYMAQGSPALQLEHLQAAPANTTMNELCQEALGLTVDEHVYKLVQVCYDLSQQHSEPDNVTLYKVACRCAIDHPLPNF